MPIHSSPKKLQVKPLSTYLHTKTKLHTKLRSICSFPKKIMGKIARRNTHKHLYEKFKQKLLRIVFIQFFFGGVEPSALPSEASDLIGNFLDKIFRVKQVHQKLTKRDSVKV